MPPLALPHHQGCSNIFAPTVMTLFRRNLRQRAKKTTAKVTAMRSNQRLSKS